MTMSDAGNLESLLTAIEEYLKSKGGVWTNYPDLPSDVGYWAFPLTESDNGYQLLAFVNQRPSLDQSYPSHLLVTLTSYDHARQVTDGRVGVWLMDGEHGIKESGLVVTHSPIKDTLRDMAQDIADILEEWS